MHENTANKPVKHILYCNCGGERIQEDVKKTVEKALQDASVKVTVLSDLCGMVALNKDKLEGLFSEESEIMVIGCYKRTMTLLFDQIRDNLVPDTTEHLNLIDETVETATKKIAAFKEGAKRTVDHMEITGESDWPSWYPIIDTARCTNCGQCADFCLFGVYEKSETHPEVVHPQGCKNGCPACGRICPTTAIIFPKYKHGGAIGGSDEIDEQAEQQRQAQDIGRILGDDLYDALERRKIKRRSIIREETMMRAITERENALVSPTKKITEKGVDS